MNHWRNGFFILLGIDLLIIVTLFVMVMKPGNNINIPPESKEPTGEYVPFYIQSNKQDLNKLVNYYLQKEASGSPIDYRVVLGNEVELYGTMPMLSEALDLKMTFVPQALENGDLILRQKSISVGSLNLPVPYVLEFIAENYKLPAGVTISPNEKLVYISMQNLKLQDNAKVKVNKFDLNKNDIAFTLLVPVK